MELYHQENSVVLCVLVMLYAILSHNSARFYQFLAVSDKLILQENVDVKILYGHMTPRYTSKIDAPIFTELRKASCF